MSLSSIEWGAKPRKALGSPLFAKLVVDLPLLLTLFAVTVFGLVVLYSAGGEDPGRVARQAARAALGFGAFFVMAQIQPRYLRIWTPWLYCAVLGLLLAVAVEGEISQGAQRWLDVGVVRFQPSELMKLAAPMMVAWFLHDRTLPPNLPQLVVITLMVFVPAILIARQPDLGTALLIIAAGGLTVLLTGISVRLILGCGAIASEKELLRLDLPLRTFKPSLPAARRRKLIDEWRAAVERAKGWQKVLDRPVKK